MSIHTSIEEDDDESSESNSQDAAEHVESTHDSSGRDNILAALTTANLAAKNCKDKPDHDRVAPPNAGVDPSLASKLAVALESLETMRRLNLEVEFSDAGSPFPVDHNRCTYTQREELREYLRDPERWQREGVGSQEGRAIAVGSARLDGSRLRRFGKNVSNLFSKSVPSAGAGDSITSATTIAVGNLNQHGLLRKAPLPCFACGQPVCARHTSSEFSKRHITVCKACANLFDLDFLVDIIATSVADARTCRQKVDTLIDCYDRTRLLLLYAAQYSEEVASSLEARTCRSNRVGVGASATGVASGVAGMVGCGALLISPGAVVGVPLLITSLVFGGGATAAQTGDAAAQYFSKQKRFAGRMVALHGMASSLLRIVEVLSHVLLKERLGVTYSVQGRSQKGREINGTQREALRKEVRELLERHGSATTQAAVGGLQSAVTTGIVTTELTATGASAVGRGGRYLGRVGATAGRTARFVPVVGGVLSAACIYVEGKELSRKLNRIKEGSPCAMAQRVREIAAEARMLPDSSTVADECQQVSEMVEREGEWREAKAREAAKLSPNGIGGGGGGDNARGDVDAKDISDMISVIETSANVDALGNEG